MESTWKNLVETVLGQSFKPLCDVDGSMIQLSGWVSPCQSGLSLSVWLKVEVQSNSKGGFMLVHRYFMTALDEQVSTKNESIEVPRQEMEAALEKGACLMVAACVLDPSREFLQEKAPRLYSMLEAVELDVEMRDAPPESPTPFKHTDPFDQKGRI